MRKKDGSLSSLKKQKVDLGKPLDKMVAIN